MFDRRAIAKEAHRIARRYRDGDTSYAEALSWGFRSAWRDAKESARWAAYEATLTPEFKARRDETISIQCSTDGRLSSAQISRLTELSRAA